MNNPAISVIIPMYNAAEFIAECLDSILLQTFQDFEVIIVDDCSDDNCVEIAESYLEKFGGRLRVARTETNSGGGGYVPRNIGLSMASGEYVYFVDADDFILLTALETLYAAAKEHDADVVYFAAQYWLRKPDAITVFRDEIANRLLSEELEDEPTLFVDDTEKILLEVLENKHHRTPWTKFIRRTLLTENNILFPEVIVGGDVIWTIDVYAHAERFLRLPISLYFLRRYHTTSVIKTKRPIWGYNPELNAGFVVWFKGFTALARRTEFLSKNVDACCGAAKDYFDYFARGLFVEDKYRCMHDVRDTLLAEMPADYFDLTKGFIALTEEEERSSRVKPPSTCAVSVIISLYNYGGYVGECLDNLLEQTFTDFEIIIVDDCSTDNSVEVVESYREKFGERLILAHTEKNSGSAGVPRNIGLTLARGKYVFFMDADDALVPTGLEEMYAFAAEYYADVVYCEKYFTSEGFGQDFKDNARIAETKCQRPPFVDEPTLESANMNIRISRAEQVRYWVTAWLRLVRRDLLLEHEINFSTMKISEDAVWCCQVLLCSKRFLRVPNAYYIRRMHEDSISAPQSDLSKYVYDWMERTICNLRFMENFMLKLDITSNAPGLRYKMLNHFINTDFAKIESAFHSLAPFQVAAVFREAFGNYLGEHDLLVSMLCANINSKRKNLKYQEWRIADLRQKLSRVSPLGYPAVSVIVPMYNAEEFIGECLDSLLEQVFTGFEVIVVDDCSTDNSVEIVESYIERFDGRLRLVKTKTNSGGASIPRNLGLKISHGEYVYFVDADDFIMSTALRRLYAAAREYDADVIYMSSYYNLQAENEVRTMREPLDRKVPRVGLRGRSILTVDEPEKMLQSLLFNETMPASWRKFVRREFLLTNEIFFPEISTGEDFLWNINLTCHPGRFLRITVPFYFYRSYNPESILRKQRKTATAQVTYWSRAFVAWSRAFSELAKCLDILRDNPEYRHRALTLKFHWCMGHIAEEINRVYASNIYEDLCREFDAENESPDLSAMAFLFGNIILQRRRTTKLKEQLDEIAAAAKQSANKK